MSAVLVPTVASGSWGQPRVTHGDRSAQAAQQLPPSAAPGAAAAGLGVCAAGGAALAASRASARRGRRQAKRFGGVARLATTIEEAPQKVAEEAIKAAVKAVDKDEPGQEEIDDDGCRVSYVSHQLDPSACDQVDEDGLPLVYSVTKLNEYWGKDPAGLTNRWGDFLGYATPWIGKAFGAAVTGNLQQQEASLAREAVDAMQDLGPTFIKLGQVLSIRPDVLPKAAMDELSRLQDEIATFDSDTAREILQNELGDVTKIFSEISEEPVAAASLAQVYKGKLLDGTEVAIKVQRPNALPTISKDLYVMRKAAGVVTELSNNLTATTTDFKALVETFGEGLYTELDFRNEAYNQIKMSKYIEETPNCKGVIVPRVYLEHTTRRVLVSQWIDGTKLSDLPAERIKSGIKEAQEVFLNQLLAWGFFHGDPHPGNLLYVNSGPDEGKLVLLDFGLIAQIPETDRDNIVSAVIHLGTRNWDGLVDDLIALKFLEPDCDRAAVTPPIVRVLEQYLKGGGAQAMNFYALGQDILTLTTTIPFSIPPYVSLLARSVVTLEGIALKGDPGYQLVGEAYPYMVRKLLERSGSGNAQLTMALRGLLLDGDGRVQAVRLSALLQAAVGVAAAESDRDGFIDFDAVPEDGASPDQLVGFLLSPGGKSVKPLIVRELATTIDLVLRSAIRSGFSQFKQALKPPLPFAPTPPLPPIPLLTPGGPKLMSPDDLVDAIEPRLSRDEEIYLQTNAQVFLGLLGVDVDPNKGVDLSVSPQRVMEVIGALASQKDDDIRTAVQQLLSKSSGRALLTEWWGDVFANLREEWGKRIAAV
jgi:predicted unusual protein kinase regulating ubiquinone biosynthesis (AarF/ABC1/UbiB family)